MNNIKSIGHNIGWAIHCVGQVIACVMITYVVLFWVYAIGMLVYTTIIEFPGERTCVQRSGGEYVRVSCY